MIDITAHCHPAYMLLTTVQVTLFCKRQVRQHVRDDRKPSDSHLVGSMDHGYNLDIMWSDLKI